ncbi:MAG: hypothetical protein E3J88_04325 [Anaerolineales bacterium]|nr:MAG: hypothetical protein E3J88_04325 [Anaerolineales bacterium]
MTSFIYNIGKKEILSGEIDLTNDTIKVALVTSSYSADKDAHEHFDDITNEVVGTPYVAGGATLANKSFNADNTNDRGEFDADDVTWSVATLTARAAIVYKSTGVAATSTLFAYWDFLSDYSTSGEDFTIEWDSEGVLYLGE